MHKTLILLSASVLALSACDTLYPPTPKPDNTIKVVQTSKGPVAIPPTCLDWASATTNPYDNQPLPQFGCATARNLAMMVDQPNDLIHGREMSAGRAVTTVGAIRRYDNNQTRGLIDPDSAPDTSVAATTSSTAASPLTGDITGSTAASTGASSSTSAAPAAAAP
jgi:hypothetical protein